MHALKGKPLFLLIFLLVPLHCHALTDSDILLKFKESLSNASALANWNNGTAPCMGDEANWNGVICVKGVIWGLQLENMGLTGNIDVDSLASLPELKSLSFMNNSFEGSLPEFKKLLGLRSVFVSNNHFSGEIPGDAFEGMTKLKKVHMAQNEFQAAIPSSLAALPKLIDLMLEGNQFTGQVPEFTQSLQTFNVSNNALEGPIPASLSKMNLSSFTGNKGLCGPPLAQCATTPSSLIPSASSSNSNQKTKKLSLASVIAMGIVAALALAAIIGALSILLRHRKRTPAASVEAPQPSNLQTKTGLREPDQGLHSSPDQSGNGRNSGKLSFVRDDRERFDLPDLLKASAEILGSGCFGSSYKAALSPGQVMVVKRFKQMNNVGKEEFQEHMRRLGRLRHPNLLPLVAYYYRKEEKLLVSDFVEKGSLAVHLHGHEALGQPSLDWPGRLRIIRGIARGLAYLSKELPSVIAAHGHLKSSNILLGESYEPVLTDYGLVPVINQENAHEFMVAYKSPEYVQNGRITKKTDVWSLGMIILEILTGKFPANSLSHVKGSEEEDLASWVNSVPQEEWFKVVLDKEIRTAKNSEGEMLKLLKIGLGCCEVDVEKRLDLREAVERIEDLKEKDYDDDFYSSYASEGDIGSKKGVSRGKSDDFNF